ncbi:MAG: PAS domain-containing protein [Nitrospirae bacterium]|nr:PAS domain-containing protein [Nitrospirota bacterium]
MKGYLLIIVTLIVIISALITLSMFFQESLQMEMAEQFSKQQLLLSQTITDNITTYLSFLKQDVLHLAGMLSKLEIPEKTYDELQKKEIIKHHIGILDSKGNVILFKGNKNSLKQAVPDILEQSKTMTPGSTTIMKRASIAYAISPIYRQDQFSGVALLSVSINDIANHFVSAIKTGPRGYAWIMDKEGDLLYHPSQQGMVGRNLYKTDTTCFNCHQSFNLEKTIIEGKAKDFGRYIAPTGEDKIIAFSTASIDNISWIVAASAPYSEVTYATKSSMRLYSYLILSIFTTTTIISIWLIIFNKKHIQAEEMVKRKQELERYATKLEEKVKERTTELVSEKEKLNTIVSAIGGGIVLIDKHGIIQWTNQTIKDMAGMDVTGKACEDICPDCHISGEHNRAGINTIIVSNLFGKKDKYFQITTAPVKGEDGGIHGYIRLIQDVTEMKKMEEQIGHSEKLASLGRLAAGIAHEIGNPLTSIFSFVQILKEAEEDKFKKESLETVHFHINRISDILKQLSGFTKMPRGEIKECNINEVIETSVNIIHFDKKSKGIAIIKELSSELSNYTCICDSNQLSQVFVNLTLNAIDSMSDGGTLTVRSMLQDGNIKIQFEDTGFGIPKEDLPKIFDPFYTTKEKGTGLGLAVSYDIIKKMNGSITVESEVGKGSVFTVTIPCNIQ